MSACWPEDDNNVSLTATGQAIYAMNAELDKLIEEREALHKREQLIVAKMKSCHSALERLVEAALRQAGESYGAKSYPKYPALHSWD